MLSGPACLHHSAHSDGSAYWAPDRSGFPFVHDRPSRSAANPAGDVAKPLPRVEVFLSPWRLHAIHLSPTRGRKYSLQAPSRS